MICLSFLSFKKLNSKPEFVFKTLATSYGDFKLDGSIAFDNNVSSIYISHITYEGLNKDETYKTIKCTLYETNKNTKTVIMEKTSLPNQDITLQSFLQNIDFKIDKYEQICKKYDENTLHLEIDAIDEYENTISYKIPLKLEDNC